MKYKLTTTLQRSLLKELVENSDFYRRWILVLHPNQFKGESAERGKILQLIMEEGKDGHAPSFVMLEQVIEQERDRDTRRELLEELEEIEVCHKKIKATELDHIVQKFITNSKAIDAMEQQLKLIEEGRFYELGKPLEKLYREGVHTHPADDYFAIATSGSDRILGKRMPTGWESLDKYSFGGFGEGELWTVMGQEFKTQILLHFCRTAMLLNVSSYYDTLEVSKGVLGARMTCLQTGCSLGDAIREELWVLEKLARMEKFMRSPFVIKEHPMHSVGVEQIKSEVLMEEARRGLKGDRRFKLIVIDYPDLLLAPKWGKARFSTTDIYAELKRWAQEEGRRILVASQLTRQGQGSTTRGRNDISEDKTKIDNSDTVLSLNMTPEEYYQRLLRLFTVKMRVGTPNREILLTWNPRSFRFRETE